MVYPGAEVGIDQDTRVGGRAAHWTEAGGRHHLEWFSVTGAHWIVTGVVPPEALRSIAEAVEAAAGTGTA